MKKTEITEDGSEFLNEIDEFDPDLVTLDVMMPGLTTSEILKKLNGKRSQPKILLLTVVRFTEEEKKNLHDAGNVVGCITKPFNMNDLMDVMKKHMQ